MPLFIVRKRMKKPSESSAANLGFFYYVEGGRTLWGKGEHARFGKTLVEKKTDKGKDILSNRTNVEYESLPVLY